MKTFQQFLEARHWRDWPPEEPDADYQQYVQQEEDLAELNREVERYNRMHAGSGQVMSISTSGDRSVPRDSDHFILYINREEITSGDIPELMQRIRQITKEEGY